MGIRKFYENDTFEFYDSRGTYQDAKEVQKELLEKHGKDGVLKLNSNHGWIVMVRKNNK